jgi:hypothetical protein
MEFGMFHEFPSLPGRTESEAFDEAMEQVTRRWSKSTRPSGWGSM